VVKFLSLQMKLSKIVLIISPMFTCILIRIFNMKIRMKLFPKTLSFRSWKDTSDLTIKLCYAMLCYSKIWRMPNMSERLQVNAMFSIFTGVTVRFYYWTKGARYD